MSSLFKSPKRPKPPPPPPLPPEPEKPQAADLDNEEPRRRRGLASTIFAGYGTLGQPGRVFAPTLLGQA